MTSGQARFPIAPSIFKFNQFGKSGTWVSELLPWTSKIVDDICLIKSVYTEQINHEPAITFIQTGNQNAGKACLGSWLSYGLGSLNENLPTFVVLTSKFSWKKIPRLSRPDSGLPDFSPASTPVWPCAAKGIPCSTSATLVELIAIHVA